ncbi:DUF2255 family protein [Actinomadura xylanilytica]|uniref:DUF2255 family protein n=1 Tax=Actinomadura xylanilytica TaxID=887459 RepID=UPI00255AEC9C|nr:DUF2255 family protein [Actinomadura xylanilytica]MDL4770804.1 DUF2255 family protein [Actinomadura xylanilytica]
MTAPTTDWTSDELARIENTDELEIAPMLDDGSLRHPTTIWVVRAGDDLYVRSANGTDGAWYRGAQERHEGRIEAGGVGKEVTFVNADGDADLNDRLDAEYRAKYRGYDPRYVDPMTTPETRAATLRLVPLS